MLGLCKCSQVQGFKAKVFSNKHRLRGKTCTALRHNSRYQKNVTGRLKGEKKRRAELRCQTAEVFLLLYYRVLQLCRCVCLSGVDIEPLGLRVEKAKCCTRVVGLGGIDGRLGVMEGEWYVRMSWKQLFPRSNDYLRSPFLIYGHPRSLLTAGAVAGRTGCSERPNHTPW